MALLGILLAFSEVRQPLTWLLSAASQGDGPTIRNTLRAYGPFAPAVSIALILLHAVVPLPAELLTLANGLAFGFWGGLTVSWSGFMLSALSIYAAGRLWCRPLLDRTVPQRYRERLDGWLEREGAFSPYSRFAWYFSRLSTPFAWRRGPSALRFGPTTPEPPGWAFCR